MTHAASAVGEATGLPVITPCDSAVLQLRAFIGSDTQLIAPVTIGKDAYVGSGTTIREDVPPGALAVSAGKQRNIDGWVEKKKSENRKSKVKS